MVHPSDATGRRTFNAEAASLTWRKSTWSIGNGSCVEAARLSDGHLAVRDSKDKAGPALLFTPGEWHAFIAGVKAGEFELETF